MTAPPLTRRFKAVIVAFVVTLAVVVAVPGAEDAIVDRWWAFALFLAWAVALARAAWRTAPHEDLWVSDERHR